MAAVTGKLYLLDPGSCMAQYPRRMNQASPVILEMTVLYSTLDIAFFTENGFLWVGSSDLQNTYLEFDTKCPNRPSQMGWCGCYDPMTNMTSAIVLVWEGYYKVVGVGNETEALTYPIDSTVYVSSESDGARIISAHSHEMVRKVPQVMVDVLIFGSREPGSLLYDAQKEYENDSYKANEYMQHIVESKMIDGAVNQCIQAAACTSKTKLQKSLLRAASYGRCFLSEDDPEPFVRMCKTLRVLNEVGQFRIGIPLTYKQLNDFGVSKLIDRLVKMRLYFLALPIVEYLAVEEGHQVNYSLYTHVSQTVIIFNQITYLTRNMIFSIVDFKNILIFQWFWKKYLCSTWIF